MPAPSDSSITITRDHFLGPLGLPDDPQMKPRARHELFVAVVQYLRERGLINGVQSVPAQESTRLDLLIPGTPIHVSLSALNDRELKEIVAIAVAMGFMHGSKDGITLGGLLTLKRMVSRLRSEYGERSIVEVVALLKRATVDEILTAMHGESCRHPGGGCRYEHGGLCQIGASALESTLSELATRDVLRRRTTVDPVVWSVVL